MLQTRQRSELRKRLQVTKTICQLGFRCGQECPQPAKAVSGFDRKATLNPQLHIVPYVNNIKYTTIEKSLIFFNHIKKGMFLKSYYYNFLMDKVSLVIDLYDKSNYIGNKHYYNAKNPLTLQNKISPPIT